MSAHTSPSQRSAPTAQAGAAPSSATARAQVPHRAFSTTSGTERRGRIRRRSVLTGVGAGLVLVAAGGAWRAGTRGVLDPTGGPAFEPWAEWQGKGRDDPTALVSAAILASNAHNAQPWLFRIQDARVDLFEDEGRSLGSLDPFGREMHIGLGCALENLLLAAHATGYEHELVLAPESEDPARAATVLLSPGPAAVSSLYTAIPHRHTNRHPFDTSRPVPRSTVTALDALNDDPGIRVRWCTSRAERETLHDLLVGAAGAINADAAQSYDNGPRWLRTDRSTIDQHRDGLTLDTMGLAGPAVLAAKMLPDPGSDEAGRAWLTSVHDQARTAGAFGILAVRDDRDRAQRMRCGRLWQRIHLWATARGLAAQPMNQLHERADRETQLDLEPEHGGAVKELFGDPGWRALFTFRIGHPTRSAPLSPRRPVPQVLTA